MGKETLAKRMNNARHQPSSTGKFSTKERCGLKWEGGRGKKKSIGESRGKTLSQRDDWVPKGWIVRLAEEMGSRVGAFRGTRPTGRVKPTDRLRRKIKKIDKNREARKKGEATPSGSALRGIVKRIGIKNLTEKIGRELVAL